MHSPTEKKPWYRILYVQVLIAVFIGIVVGYLNPGLGKSLKTSLVMDSSIWSR